MSELSSRLEALSKSLKATRLDRTRSKYLRTRDRVLNQASKEENTIPEPKSAFLAVQQLLEAELGLGVSQENGFRVTNAGLFTVVAKQDTGGKSGGMKRDAGLRGNDFAVDTEKREAAGLGSEEGELSSKPSKIPNDTQSSSSNGAPSHIHSPKENRPPSKSPHQPLTFHLFKNLPSKLRKKIWQLTMSKPQLIHLYFRRYTKFNTHTPQLTLTSPNPLTFSYHLTGIIPFYSILNACLESKREWNIRFPHEVWHQILLDKVFFNKDIDTLRMDTQTLYWIFHCQGVTHKKYPLKFGIFNGWGAKDTKIGNIKLKLDSFKKGSEQRKTLENVKHDVLRGFRGDLDVIEGNSAADWVANESYKNMVVSQRKTIKKHFAERFLRFVNGFEAKFGERYLKMPGDGERRVVHVSRGGPYRRQAE